MITSHDMRRIKVCSLCGELGIYRPLKAEVDVPLVICTNLFRAPGRVADFQHPTCYAGASITKLMILPPEERGFIRLCDVTSDQMDGLLVAGKYEAQKNKEHFYFQSDSCLYCWCSKNSVEATKPCLSAVEVEQ